MTILEVGIALIIATSAAMAVVQLVNVATRHRRTSHQRQLAVLEVANQAERLALLAWDDTTPENLTTWQPSPLLAAEMPSAQCTIEATDSNQPLPTRRIDLFVAWTTSDGQAFEPARLTIWKHKEAPQE